MTWNYDMSAAPKGRTVDVDGIGPKGAPFTKKVFQPDIFIACEDSDAHAVITTYWIEKSQRWSGFGVNETPLCWQPWPIHPKKGD